MLIRKNSLVHQGNHSTSSPQKLTSPTLNNSKEKQAFSTKKPSHFQELSYDQLLQKLKKQQIQIQKLTKIIDLYKLKISEFSEYEHVIQQFLRKKDQEKIKQKQIIVMQQNKKPTIYEKQTQSAKKKLKNLQTQIFHVLNIKIESKVQHISRQQQKFQSLNKTLSSQASSQLSEKSQVVKTQIKPCSIHKQKVLTYFTPKYIPRQINQNFNLHVEGQNLNNPQCLMANLQKNKNLQRIPSLQNMRRMEKCFKLLNS